MAITKQELTFAIGADSRKFNREMGKMKKTAKTTGSSIASSMGLAMGAAGIGMTIAQIFKMGAALEQTEVAFEVLIGSAKEANQVLDELRSFSDVTPFEPDQVIKAGRALIAMGISVDDLMPNLKAIGDIAAGTGKDFNELAVIFGKAKASGRVMGDDLRQLAEAGIPIIGQFAKQFGVAESEIRNMASKGKISFEDLEQAFASMSGEGGKFNDMMKKQSETAAGQWSTAVGRLKNQLSDLGKAFLPLIEVVNFASAAFEKFIIGLKAGQIIAKRLSEWQSGMMSAGDTWESMKDDFRELKSDFEKPIKDPVSDALKEANKAMEFSKNKAEEIARIRERFSDSDTGHLEEAKNMQQLLGFEEELLKVREKSEKAREKGLEQGAKMLAQMKETIELERKKLGLSELEQGVLITETKLRKKLGRDLTDEEKQRVRNFESIKDAKRELEGLGEINKQSADRMKAAGEAIANVKEESSDGLESMTKQDLSDSLSRIGVTIGAGGEAMLKDKLAKEDNKTLKDINTGISTLVEGAKQGGVLGA